jgi:hypothetical protein
MFPARYIAHPKWYHLASVIEHGQADDGESAMSNALCLIPSHCPWNKGILVGQKMPLKPKHVWSIRVRLEIAKSYRDLALFNLAIDSKLRACDLVRLRIDDVCAGGYMRDRAMFIQKKTGKVARFEIMEQLGLRSMTHFNCRRWSTYSLLQPTGPRRPQN